mmetsp:Transcript_27568/g.59256  ORF Transcript_27568/g.59256 Transcript_27568/m.59256 type:complete len:595 (+) Transcript_27568:151-1935(+)
MSWPSAVPTAVPVTTCQSQNPTAAVAPITTAPTLVPNQPSANGAAATQAPTKPNASSPNTKKMKRTSAPTSLSSGVIDPQSNIQGGSIENLDGEPCDVMLAHVDPFTHSDKFSVLQLIQVQRAFGKAYVVYTRGGSTGTVGQSTEQEFYGLEAAVACFKDELEQKTGLDWKDRMDPIKPNKYRFVVQNFTQKQAGFSGGTWQYWVDDGIDGKSSGWYDYSDSREVERLYQEYTSNTNTQNLCQRYISSGHFTYNVDLDQMVQTNVTHPNRTSRRIRRVDVNAPLTPSHAPAPLRHSVASSRPGLNHYHGASAPPQATVRRAARRAASAPSHYFGASAPPQPPVQRSTPTLASRMSTAISRTRRSSPPKSHILKYTAPLSLSTGVPSDALCTPPVSCNMKEYCIICHDHLDERPCVALNACKHVFHTDCIQLAFKSKPQCPVCRAPIGKPQGHSPSGTMTVSVKPTRCSGFRVDSIFIAYNIPSGVQMNYHEHPGRQHGGKCANAYLPNNVDGQNLLKRLKYSWLQGLSFTVGTSFTTGIADQCTWASVHHKTSTHGGAQGHGYPDPGYFGNCNSELDSLGVPSAQELNDDGSTK